MHIQSVIELFGTEAPPAIFLSRYLSQISGGCRSLSFFTTSLKQRLFFFTKLSPSEELGTLVYNIVLSKAGSADFSLGEYPPKLSKITFPLYFPQVRQGWGRMPLTAGIQITRSKTSMKSCVHKSFVLSQSFVAQRISFVTLDKFQHCRSGKC